MNQNTVRPAHSASVPPRFKPQLDRDGSLLFWGADLVADDTLHAEAVKYPAIPEVTLYTIALNVEEGTAEDIRTAMDRLCAWWSSQEGHLDGTEVAQ